jgi:hypothetical protein
MRARNVCLTILCAALAFGGTFTCKSGDVHDEDDDDNVHVPDAPPHQALDESSGRSD